MSEVFEDSFQVTLPSNIIEPEFPSNRPNSYTIKLAKPLHLEPDRWEVCLTDVQYPGPIPNVTEDTDFGILLLPHMPSVERFKLSSIAKYRLLEFMPDEEFSKLSKDQQQVAVSFLAQQDFTAVLVPDIPPSYDTSKWAPPLFVFKRTRDLIPGNDPIDVAVKRLLTNRNYADPYFTPRLFYRRLHVPKGYYQSIYDLAFYLKGRVEGILNEEPSFFKLGSAARPSDLFKIKIQYNPITRILKLDSTGPGDLVLLSTNRYIFGQLFKIPPLSEPFPGLPEKLIPDLYIDYFVGESSEATSLEVIPNMYVYSDIVLPQMVGNVERPLMGIIPLGGSAQSQKPLNPPEEVNFGADLEGYFRRNNITTILKFKEPEYKRQPTAPIFNFAYQEFYPINPTYYMGLSTNLIQSITMQLHTDWGAPFPFASDLANACKVVCRLHFRRKKRSLL